MILLYSILPAIYQSYQLYLIGNEMPSLSGLAIASQWQFVQVWFEIIQEATVLPLFFFIGSQIKQKKEVIISRLKTAFVLLISMEGLAIVLFLWFLPSFVELSGAESSIHQLTQEYLSIKIWSAGASALSLGIWIVIESLSRKKVLLMIICIKAVFMIVLDSLFFGGYSLSLNLGIIGAAYSTLLVECLIFLLGLVLLIQSLQIPLFTFFKSPWFRDIKLFRNVGLGIGLESLVKNLAYWFLILKLINELGANELGGYYLSMHLFWSFALVPILVISEATKVQIGNHVGDKDRIRQLLTIAMTLTGGIVLCWSVIWAFKSSWLALFSSDPEVLAFANTSVNYLLIPYILLGFNLVIDSLFYGLGKTQYLAYQSLLTNGTVYLGAYLLYFLGFWIPTFESVLLLFGLGILVDSGLTVYFAKKVISA
ncbi:MAG: MATE family efflux transporter [Bacteroidia bacterium]